MCAALMANVAPLIANRNISCNVANLAANTTKQWPYYPRSLYSQTPNTQQAAALLQEMQTGNWMHVWGLNSVVAACYCTQAQ